MKRLFYIFGIICLLLLTSFNNIPNEKFSITKVVIDAGHGGKDPGCIGYNKTYEKNVTLSIAIKLGKYIEDNFDNIKVVYTRSTDVFVELYERAKIANESKADLFISIHCNANESPKPYGAETYVMGIHKSEANLDVAKKENASILMEEDYSEKYDGYDPNSLEANIIFSLFQNAFLEQSLKIAAKTQTQFEKRVGLADRGVKQAGFLVLYKTTMPSILIETGFLSNQKEELFVASEQGQDYIASAIYRAFKEYKFELEGKLCKENTESNKKTDMEEFYIKNGQEIDKTKLVNSDTSNIKNNNKIPSSENNIKLNTKKNNNASEKQIITFRVQFKTTPTLESLDSPEFIDLQEVKYYAHNDSYKYTAGNKRTIQEAEEYQKQLHDKGYKDAFIIAFLNEERISTEDAIKMLKEQEQNNKITISDNGNQTNKISKENDINSKKQNIVFRVQFKTSPEKILLDSKDFMDLKDVRFYFHNNLYKYTVGNARTLQEAAKIQQELQEKGFKDAFVVAFLDENRISPQEAIELLKKNDSFAE